MSLRRPTSRRQPRREGAARLAPAAEGAFRIRLKDGPSGHAAIASGGDILRLRTFNGTTLADNWLKVEPGGVIDPGASAGYYEYLVKRMGGSAATFPAGTTVANYGAAGEGFLLLHGDDPNGPHIDVGGHNGVFSGATVDEKVLQTQLHARLGSLKGSFDYGASEVYGFGAGDYGGGPWVTVDDNNGVRIGSFTTTRLHMDLDANVVFYDDSAVERMRLEWDGGITVGRVAAGQSNVRIASGSVALRLNTTEYIRLDTSGFIRIGQATTGQSNILITAGAVKLRNNVTDVITLLASANAQGQIATFDGVIGISTNGGLYQGTGTFASPTTGIKLWNSGGVGRLAGYASGALQWEGATDGKFKAGGGNVVLDANGLRITEPSGAGGTDTAEIKLLDSGATPVLEIGVYGFAAGYKYGRLYVPWQASKDSVLYSVAEAPSGRYALLEMIAGNTGGNSVYLLVKNNNSDVGVGLHTAGMHITLNNRATGFTGMPSGTLRLDQYLEQLEMAAPAAPATGYLRWYANATHSWGYFTNDAAKNVPVGIAKIDLGLGSLHPQGVSVVGFATNYAAYQFPDATASVYCAYSFPLPAGWAGRTLTIKVLWAPTSAAAGSVVWQLLTHIVRAGTTVAVAPTNLNQLASATSGVTDRPVLLTTTHSLSSFAEGDTCYFRILRVGTDASDTYAAAANLISVELSVVS